MSRSRLNLSAVAMLLLLAASPALLSQSSSGGVNGTVRDPAKAVVPGATVTLLNMDTNRSRHAICDGAGLYNFPNVSPGNYQLTVEQKGFRTWTGSLVLQVQQLAVVDASLEVGSLASVVDVHAVTPVIAVESSNLSNVTESARIRDMPLNGMDITQLFQLTPGVEVGAYSPHVSGMNPGAADVVQDGSSIMDRQRGGINRVGVAMDTIQEFNVDTNSVAQYSHPATISMASKSGTNALHGDLFEKFRNNADGLRARQRQDGNTPAPYKRNEFGGSAGGPVELPRLYNGKDKTFWFFAYQGMRLREYTSATSAVPTDAMWNGDFSNLADGNGTPYTIYDPFSTNAQGLRTAFPGNRIGPSQGGNKEAAYLAANTPRPTTGANPLISNNYYSTAANPGTNNSYNAKLDHSIGQHDTLSGRFTIGDSSSTSYLGYGPVAPDSQYNSQGDVAKVYNAAINYVHTFSPSMINELLLSGQRSNHLLGGGREDVKWTNTYLGLSNPLNEIGWPTITAYAGQNNYIWDSQNKMPEHLTTLGMDDNFTWLRGKHAFKFGFHLSDERNNTRSNQQGQGRYKYNGDWTSQWDPSSQTPTPNTGIGLADMYLGYGSYYRANYSRPYYYLRQGQTGFYAQDSWKVTPRLTLNYGMRWDYWNPYLEGSNRMFALDMTKWQTTQQLITPTGTPAEKMGIPPSLLAAYSAAGMTWTTADKAGYPDKLMNGDKGDFAPRIGAAYRLDSKSVIRGSYGMYYWTVPNAQMLLAGGNDNPLTLQYQMDMEDPFPDPVTGALTNYYDAFHTPLASIKVGAPNMIDINSPQSVQSPFSFTPFPKDMKNARVQMWNFTLERELSATTSLRLTYTGNHSSDLMQTVNYNVTEPTYSYALQNGVLPSSAAALRVNPFWGDLGAREPVGYGNNNQIQVNLERRMNNGLQFQWYYVFTRALSTSDANEGFSSNPGQQVPDAVQLPGGTANTSTLAQLLHIAYSNDAGIPKHQFNWNFTYDLPFGRGKAYGNNISKALNEVVGGWQIAGMGGWHTGQWLTPNFNTYEPYWWAANYQMVRDPRLSGDQQKVITYQGQQRLLYFAGYFNPAGTGLTNYTPALAWPDGQSSNNLPVTLKNGQTVGVPYMLYNSMPRNFIQGPSNFNTDMSLFKSFSLRENKRLRISADAFNVFNHPNNLNPDLTTGLIDLSQSASQPRIIQFSARLEF